MNLKPSGNTVQTAWVETGCLGLRTTADTPEEFSVWKKNPVREMPVFSGGVCLHPRWCASSSFPSGLLIILLTVVRAWKKNTKQAGLLWFHRYATQTERNRNTAQIYKLTQFMHFLFPEHENKPFNFLYHDCFSYRDMNQLCRLGVLWFGGWFWHFGSNKTTTTTKTSCLVGPSRTRARSSSSRRAAVTVSHLPAQVRQTAEM